MKNYLPLLFFATSPLYAQNDFRDAYEEQRKNPQQTETKAQVLKDHSSGSVEVADAQDSLSADVQELIQEETNEKVIQFLSEAEELMAYATDKLEEHDTSGTTIAIETEIIEKIANAAKQKQQSGQQGANGALMQMLQKMMGASEGQSDKEGPKEGEGDEAASEGGDGPEGDSDAANTQSSSGDNSGATTNRKLPKKAGTAGTALPREFQKALDAYNKGLNDSSR